MYQIIGNWAFNNDFLNNRMCFLTGPRQIGKTTLSKIFLSKIGQKKNYFNWDSFTIKRKFITNPNFFIEDLSLLDKNKKQWVVFDEIHKDLKWKQILKAYYDDFKDYLNFIICGSARLDYFRKSGESLIGRYFLFKMFPLNPNDILLGEKFDITQIITNGIKFDLSPATNEIKEAINQLFEISGFPEPFLKGTKQFYLRWQKAHITLLTSEEIRDLTKIYDINRLQMLPVLLVDRISSPISINNLSNILEVAHQTVKLWLFALKNVYLIFEIPPYTLKLSRSIKKEKKCYFYDWGIINDKGKKFENFIAVQLLRNISAWNESGLGDFDLFYVRTRDGKECDFLITDKLKPFILIECKFNDINIDKNLLFFHKKLSPAYSFQLVFKKDYYKQIEKNIFIIDAYRLIKNLI